MSFYAYGIIYVKVPYLGPYLRKKPKVVINDGLGHKGIYIYPPSRTRFDTYTHAVPTRVPTRIIPGYTRQTCTDVLIHFAHVYMDDRF